MSNICFSYYEEKISKCIAFNEKQTYDLNKLNGWVFLWFLRRAGRAYGNHQKHQDNEGKTETPSQNMRLRIHEN